jgi:UDPglucose 6-dehydrogenase
VTSPVSVSPATRPMRCATRMHLLIATEWREFKSPDFEQMRVLLKEALIFDGRNLFDPALVRGQGIEYHAIGRPGGEQQSLPG